MSLEDKKWFMIFVFKYTNIDEIKYFRFLIGFLKFLEKYFLFVFSDNFVLLNLRYTSTICSVF